MNEVLCVSLVKGLYENRFVVLSRLRLSELHITI